MRPPVKQIAGEKLAGDGTNLCPYRNARGTIAWLTRRTQNSVVSFSIKAWQLISGIRWVQPDIAMPFAVEGASAGWKLKQTFQLTLFSPRMVTPVKGSNSKLNLGSKGNTGSGPENRKVPACEKPTTRSVRPQLSASDL